MGTDGDYDERGLNIINAHTLPAISLALRAGVVLNDEQQRKRRLCWEWVKKCTTKYGGTGYIGAYAVNDGHGRTAGSLLGHLLEQAVGTDSEHER